MRTIGSTFAAFFAVACLAASSFAASATVQIFGGFSGVDFDGFAYKVRFTCTGMPTCTGVGTATERGGQCSNAITFSSGVTFTGFDLTKPTFQVHIAPTTSINVTNNPDGTCNYQVVPATPANSGGDFTGTWNGTNGTITLLNSNGSGAFTASGLAPAPVFPMTVTSNITLTTASASASIQPRAQDAGLNESVFVFAHVPASLIGKAVAALGPGVAALPEEGNACVLAQLGADGKLAGVTASNMQPYLTGVLSSQGQNVTILNNVATPSVAGATFYVGYGSSAQAMFSGGIYQAAVTIPGAPQCSASFTTAPAPTPPGAVSGLWWNPNESGWGIDFVRRGNVVFAAWYTYDGAGNPKWYVASNCAMASGATDTSGTCSGALYEVTGTAFFGASFDPSRVTPKQVGTLQVTFSDASNGSMSYTVNGQSRTVSITRQIFQSGATAPAVDYTDLWWNPRESGWGMAISQQYGVMFLAWFVYDDAGKPVWYVVTDCTVKGDGCSGTLYRTTGPAFGATFDPSKVQAFVAGTASVSFGDANHATLNYTVNGVSSSKGITRQLF